MTITSALAEATAHLDPPFAVLDIAAMEANAGQLTSRAGGKPIRIASKSVRCRSVLRTILGLEGFRGILAYSLAEAIWLANDHDDVVVAYPSVDRVAWYALASDEDLAARITVMIDSVEQLDWATSYLPPTGPQIRVCLDADASYRLAGGRMHLGVRRSPVHSAEQATELALAVLDRPRFRLVGLMSYEAQIAGVGNRRRGPSGWAIRTMQAMSGRELAYRRAAVVSAVSSLTDLEFVNAGGTGSLHRTAAEESVTELAAGSGLYGPHLFDNYRSFTPHPAAFFALPVTRRPSGRYATLSGGGWVASGAVGDDKLPRPCGHLRLTTIEGAGEVQTPVTGPEVSGLELGDRVWFRHAKAGELCEHVNELHVVLDDRIVDVWPTYRGEGQAFG